MEIMPSDYQNLKLFSSEKNFVEKIKTNEAFGYLLLGVHPTYTNEKMHILICGDGVLVLEFFAEMKDAQYFGTVMPAYISTSYVNAVEVITRKLSANKALVDQEGKLKVSVNFLCVFPEFTREETAAETDEVLRSFMDQHCLFQEHLQQSESGLMDLLAGYLKYTVTECSEQRMTVGTDNVSSILHRLAPEYVIVMARRDAAEPKTKKGADEEFLVLTENDIILRSIILDKEQINIVNRIRKGNQLLLACAGSGKTVLLLAKCFKAAAENPDKKFLITCYNRPLWSMYRWLIDLAGLPANNITCMTFHSLCRSLLKEAGVPEPNDLNNWVKKAEEARKARKIKTRYYGIFIDEVQKFDKGWYKLCYNLLEHRESDDHLFVVCGDMTQKIEELPGKAELFEDAELQYLPSYGEKPWDAGEGYPKYGEDNTLRINRNYRNSIEINEYLKHYINAAKQHLLTIDPDFKLDPDDFLLGESVCHGKNKGKAVTIKKLLTGHRSNRGEAELVVDSIRKIHDEDGIPYDEIAVAMLHGRYQMDFKAWDNEYYDLESALTELLGAKDIPYCQMHKTDEELSALYGDEGVRLAKIESVSGLNFRAVILCGLMSIGRFYRSKKQGWWEEVSQTGDEEEKLDFQLRLGDTQNNIRLLYTACSRAKEVLHIVLTETGQYSVYSRLLEKAEENWKWTTKE